MTAFFPQTGQSYRGWILERCQAGEEPGKEIITKDGKKVKRFNMSGKLALLAELHQALVKIQASARNTDYSLPSLETLAAARAFMIGRLIQ